jgi:hypothetical protein
MDQPMRGEVNFRVNDKPEVSFFASSNHSIDESCKTPVAVHEIEASVITGTSSPFVTKPVMEK